LGTSLLNIKHGYAFKGEYFKDSGKYIVLTPGNFNEEGGFRRRKEKDKYYAGDFPVGYILAKGDLIVAMTEQGEGLLGSAAIVPENDKFLHNQRLGLVSAKEGVNLDLKYIYYLFNSKAVRQQIRATASGAKVRHTSPSRIGEAKVDLPPLHLQRRIGSILSAYDNLIENNTRRIAILEEMARRIYEEWFVHFRFPGHENMRMVESELGLIPEGWEFSTLNKLITVNAKSIRATNAPSEIIYIDIASVSPGIIEQKQTLKFEDAPGRARRIVTHGDVIWSCVRPNRKSFALVMNPEPNLIASTGFAVLSARSIPYSYLYFSVTTDAFVSYLTNHATGAAYPAVTATTFETATILKPDRAITDKFHLVVAPMLELCEVLKRKNINLRATRDLLLPKLISGELDVSQLPEPAEIT
jgi:type I restriction enzyme S subunit